MYSVEELQDIRGNIASELHMARRGAPTKFAFARHRYSSTGDNDGKTVQVMVVGGTNLTVALVKSGRNNVEILTSLTEPLPILHSKTALLELIDKYFIHETEILCINFAYPLDPINRDGKLDGILLKGTKEHDFVGLVGERIGETIEQHLRDRTDRKIDVALANDTVCLVISGVGKWDRTTLTGGVVGTGFNFGFFLDEKTVINVESGNFDRFPQTDSGRIIDDNSNDRGCQLFEKEVSGAYLYRHYNLYVEQTGIGSPTITSSQELAAIAEGSTIGAECARKLFERSASLAASLIAGIHDFKNEERMNILIEGSLYWKGWNYPGFVQQYLEKLGIPTNKVQIHYIQHSSVVGASRLWS